MKIERYPDGRIWRINDTFVPEDYQAPKFDEFDRPGKKIHEWLSYISDAMREIWHTFTDEQKAIIATNAEEAASREEWE